MPQREMGLKDTKIWVYIQTLTGGKWIQDFMPLSTVYLPTNLERYQAVVSLLRELLSMEEIYINQPVWDRNFLGQVPDDKYVGSGLKQGIHTRN